MVSVVGLFIFLSGLPQVLPNQSQYEKLTIFVLNQFFPHHQDNTEMVLETLN